MLPPVLVTPPWSKALRYSSATDLRCSSVMIWVVRAMVVSLSVLQALRPRPAARRANAVGEHQDRTEEHATASVWRFAKQWGCRASSQDGEPGQGGPCPDRICG